MFCYKKLITFNGSTRSFVVSMKGRKKKRLKLISRLKLCIDRNVQEMQSTEVNFIRLKKIYVAENNMLHWDIIKFWGRGHNSAPEILNYIIYRSRQFMRPYSITWHKLLPKVISPKVISIPLCRVVSTWEQPHALRRTLLGARWKIEANLQRKAAGLRRNLGRATKGKGRRIENCASYANNTRYG